MRFTDQFLNELKKRNNIEEVISGYVSLKRAGSNLKGLCPFHNEKTPSFVVYNNDTEQSFYCFGCGVGGDVITFIMRIENLGYVDAVEFLARRSGMPLPADVSPVETAKYKKINEKRERFYSLNKDAAKFFYNNLKKSKNALEYAGQRELSAELITHFGIGYASDSFQSLSDYLTGLKYGEDELIEASLCKRSEKSGQIYDCFRNRLIFPIIDVKDNVVGFGGRIIGDGQPKYLNSGDTVIYKKKNVVFGLNFAKKSNFPFFILCEGYMDVVSLHKSGFDCAIATCGTALTPEQARLIKKYRDEVVLCYDSDSAGQNATQRAIAILENAGIKIKILVVTNAKDPDEFIKKFGKDEFYNLLKNAANDFEWKLNTVLTKYDLNVLEQKARAVTEVCDIISSYREQTRRELYIEKAAKALGISPESIKTDVNNKIRRNNRTVYKKNLTEMLETTAGFGDKVNREKYKNIKASNIEEAIIGILIKHPEFSALNECKSLKEEDFVTEFNKNLFFYIINHINNSDLGTIPDFNEKYTPDEVSHIESIRRKRSSMNDTEESFAELINSLKAVFDSSEMSVADYIEKKRREQTGRN